MSLVRKWAVRTGTVFVLTQGIFTKGAVVNKVPARTERHDRGFGTLLLYYGNPGLKISAHKRDILSTLVISVRKSRPMPEVKHSFHLLSSSLLHSHPAIRCY